MLDKILQLEEFSEEDKNLLEILMRCHAKASVLNNNISTVTFVNAARGSGNIYQSIIAGISCMGGVHAPVLQARDLIFNQDINVEALKEAIEKGFKVPGFGNSFYKDKIDPSFQEFDDAITYTAQHEKLTRHEDVIEEVKGKKIYPNAAGYTALMADILKLPPGQEVWLVLAPRLASWISIF